MAEIKNLLDEVIKKEISGLNALASGSDEKSSAIKDLAALHKLRIDEIKAETEADEKRERRAMDSEQHQTDNRLKEEQAKRQEEQQKAEFALKERQVAGEETERQMKADQAERQDERQEAELALKERQVDGEEADRVRDEQFKQRQFNDQVIDRYVRIGVAAAELVLPLVFYGVWMKRGLKFEETGTYTSQTFKNLFNRFRPTRKS